MDSWPSLPYEPWRATKDTLHMYSQVLGKIRLALSPFEPQWSHVPLYVTSRGLWTSPVPFGTRTLDLELDLLGHELVVRSSGGRVERRALGGTVAEFYADVMRIVAGMGVEVAISVLPSEVDDPIPFPDDRSHATYVAKDAERFFTVLSMVAVVMNAHRARFRGRTTPVQFFWGTFDLALLRFSGRRLEVPPGAGVLRSVSGDAEAICAGWWPGDGRYPEPAFYSYPHPAPAGVDRVAVEPADAAWNPKFGEFFLRYDAARSAADPRAAIERFFASTYAGAAGLLGWDADLTDVHPPSRSRRRPDPQEVS